MPRLHALLGSAIHVANALLYLLSITVSFDYRKQNRTSKGVTHTNKWTIVTFALEP
jgi:hypothetical protein